MLRTVSINTPVDQVDVLQQPPSGTRHTESVAEVICMNAQQFKEHRLQLRLSQPELKDTLNRRLGRAYDKSKISRWENGREPIPRDVAVEVVAIGQARPLDARVLAFANQKGGVGKTTSVLNVAAELVALGRRVLVVDMDPQATATAAVLAGGGVEAYRQGRTTAHAILGGKPLAEVIVRAGQSFGDAPSSGRGAPFDLVPSHIDLAETDGRREPGFDAALREALSPIRGAYDWIVLDAPPNLGMLTWMTLAAATDVIIPVRTEPYDAMGVGLILATANKVQRRLNPDLRVAGVLPTQFGPRRAVDREVLAHLAIAVSDRIPLLEPVPLSAAFGHAARDGRVSVSSGQGAVGVNAGAVYNRLALALSEGNSLPRADVTSANVKRSVA